MSHVAPAVKQVSENPAGNAVTAPTDPEFKKVDVERKMRFYGVIEAFRQGKYPSNQQIESTLNHVLNNSPIETTKLSKDGRELIEDFQDIIRTAKQIVEEKNEDELLQNFLYDSRHVDTSKVNLKEVTPGVNKDEAQRDSEDAVAHLRTLGKLIFTNSEARKLLKDIGILGRDVAADAAAKASDLARPAEHELNNVDEPAPSNQWVGPDGQTRDHTEPVPDTGLAEKKEKAKEAKEQAKNKASDIQDEAQSRGENIANAADQAQQQQGGEYAADEDRAKAAADAGADQAEAEKNKLKNKIPTFGELKGKIPQEHKDRAKEQKDKLKDYADDKFPQERRDRFIYRLKKVIVENQRHHQYQEAIEFFLDKAENYGNVATDATAQGGDKALNVRNDEHYQSAENELRTLLERFANGQPIQPIFDAADQLYTDAKNDEELRNWFKKLDSYVRQVLQEPGYILKDQSDRDGRQLREESKRFFDPKQGKYAGHKDALFDSIQTFFTAYADDPLNVQLGKDVKKLTTDLLYDSEGSLKYKPHLWEDVRKVILPSLAKNIGYIPIPRVEYTDNAIDLVVENLTLESQNLLPNIIEIEARNYFKVSPYDQIKDQSRHSFWISTSQTQADLRDVAFYVKKKTGFPKITDSGVADIFLGGKGVSTKIHVESTGRKNHAFKVVDVKVKIDTLKFAVRESKHSFLITVFKSLGTGLIKKAIAKAAEEAIRELLVQVDAQISDLNERVEDAEDADGLSGKFNAVKTSLREKKAEAEAAKDKAEDKIPSGQFQLTGQRDSKLIDWESKHSIVGNQGRKQEAAKKTIDGVGWKSPAFDIIDGASSTSSSSAPRQHVAAPQAGATPSLQPQGDLSRSSAPAPHTAATPAGSVAQEAVQKPTGSAGDAYLQSRPEEVGTNTTYVSRAQ